MDQELVGTVLRQSHALEQRLSTVRPTAFASRRVQLLLDATENLNKAIRQRFRDYDPARTDALVERSLERLMIALLELRFVVLPAIEHGAIRARPIEVMLAIEELLKTTLRQEVVALAAPGELHEVGTLDLWRRPAAAATDLGLDDPVGKARVRFIRLTYAEAEKDNVLLHCNLVHEVGHELIKPFRWGDLLSVITGDGAILALGQRVQPQNKFAALDADEQARVMHELLARDDDTYEGSGILFNWFEELLADAVGVVVLGPAAALALAEWLNLQSFESADRWSRNHPRWSFRIDLQRSYLEREIDGRSLFDQMMEYPKALDYLESTHARHSAAPVPPDALGTEEAEGFTLARDGMLHEALERALRNKFDAILDAVASGLEAAGVRLTPGAFRTEVPTLVEQLMLLIPPGTTGQSDAQRPASYAAIVNAGAMVRFDKLDDLVDAVPSLKADEEASRGAGSFRAGELVSGLVRKAIADSLLFQRWQRAKKSA